ncbi:IPT/TIG domain-containing protein [Intrasporangium sp. YIM S08009]|uniref:IPT/TIG domain-containing protein n=1 Tax=Intrasporangium zincisolvens TaxID=3080018 RepID=UPI002B05EE0E|nr:IPT/TIG domain-containing protein [Intrasporangium sp. YIM S08009]
MPLHPTTHGPVATPRHPRTRHVRRLLASAVTLATAATLLPATAADAAVPTVAPAATTAAATVATVAATAVAVPGAVSLSVVAGPVRGGTTVDLSGTNVGSATTAWFGGTAVTKVLRISATRIRVTTPARPAGVVYVRVSNAAGFSPQTLRSTFAFDAVPTLTRLSTTSGTTKGGTSVTLTGTGLTRASAVRFGTTSAPIVARVSSTQLRVTAPAHTAGLVDVRATTPGGTSAAVTATRFRYSAPATPAAPSPTTLPAVTKLSTSAGPTAGAQTLTISGLRLTGVTSVLFGTTRTTKVTQVSAGTIRVVTPARPAGTVDVRVTSKAGTSPVVAAGRYRYEAMPTVTKVSPSSGPSRGGTVVTLTGTNLGYATSVFFGSTRVLQVTRVSATTLRVTAPAHAAGTVWIRATSAGGWSAVSPATTYTFGAPPAVTRLSTDAGPLAGGTVVTVSGTHLEDVTSVRFGTTAGTDLVVVNGTTLRVTTPAHAAGTVAVRAVNANGTSPDVAAASFTYEPAPRVTALSVPAGPLSGGTVVTLTGTTFGRAKDVTFDGVSGTGLVRVSSTQVRITSPAHAAGTVDVRVVAPGGTSATGAASRFDYLAVPGVTAVTPSLSKTKGGTTVTVTGTGFDRVSAVSLGTTPATAFTRVSSTTLTVTLPARPEGVVNLRVTTPGGTSPSAAANAFTYQDPPVVTLVTPSSGPLVGGNTVTLSGTSFQNASAVLFNGVPALSFTRVSATKITAVVPPRIWTGAMPVRVTTPAGTVTKTNAYLYDAGSQLQPGQSMTAGTSMHSPRGGYTLTLQTTGDLVLTKGTTRVWSAGTKGTGNRLSVRADGNVVVVNASGTAIWSSATAGWAGAHLSLGDDGLLLLSQGTTPVWDHRGMRYDRLLPGQTLRSGESLQSVNTSWRLTMRTDGNLVVTTAAGRLQWSALTTGSGNVAVMRADGSFVVQSRTGSVLWSTSTGDADGAIVRMLGDANLAVYDGPKVVWAITGGPGPRSWSCYSRGTQTCITRFGYYGQRAWNYPVDAWGNNCTNFSAYRLSRDGIVNPGNLGNANTWDDRARAKGLVVDQKPKVGTIAQWNSNHVAYVDWVSADGNKVAISESGYGGTVLGVTYTSMSGRRILTRGTSSWPSNFIHFR